MAVLFHLGNMYVLLDMTLPYHVSAMMVKDSLFSDNVNY